MAGSVLQTTAQPSGLNEQGRRRERLTAIIQNGLPPFPHTAMELSTILSGPSADVKKAAKLIRTDASLSAQVLRLCNSPLFGLRSRVIGIEQAAVLLGADRLRTLALTGSLVDFAGHGLPQDQVTAFWQHSFLAAMLSEHLAKRRDYHEKEQAYIGGLLHDIGQIPHWMLACEDEAQKKGVPPDNWQDNIFIEREHFGMDHCEIGSRMAVTWNFMPSFIDVLVSHHEPEHAEHDPYLVQIVAAIEHYLLTRTDRAPAAIPGSETQPQVSADATEPLVSRVAQVTHQPFDDEDWQAIAASLDVEYERLLPIVQGGLKSVVGAN